MTPRLLVTLGDPRGVGPEVTATALRMLRQETPDVEVRLFGADPRGVVPDDLPVSSVTYDGSERSAGTVAGEAIEAAVRAALAGEGDALVTAPIHKPALRAGGWTEPGHTELLMRLTGVPEVGMLMSAERTRLGGALRVLLATTHLPLRDVPGRVTSDLLVAQTRLLERELRTRFGIDTPRIGLCALNPHASDAGMFGDEEARVYAPALAALDDLEVTGPIPADTVFSRALAGEFDAVVAPYHDVGMAAFKTVSFGAGVNVTLGLPFPRTSPDHGTAFDRVGTDTIDASSMLEALRLAVRLARSRVARNHL
ncbi:MAG TPA: 4-hydroxythreonine-4-phosphate dehydrogenase PdxA [Longimicrobiales bacterium]|nr:4-hydroxythreonine-4-phosphate dehydrogenase PdxA [Longimicrobiales bacterium]